MMPLFARPTTEALRGIYGGLGKRRGARRPAHAVEELLQGIIVARGAKERRADGRALSPGQCSSDAPIVTPFGGGRALERRRDTGAGAAGGVAGPAQRKCRGGGGGGGCTFFPTRRRHLWGGSASR